ncbi:MAG: DUF4190 domain-containing protein [Clostridia bacterium]|nr:DUF4190 domain-containing protein [Clostridia bacterium]
MNNFDYQPQGDFSNDYANSFSELSPKAPGHAKGYAIASLVLGIVGVVFACFCCCLYYLAAVLAVISIVMAFLARRDNNKKMPGMAIAGLILAIVAILGCLIMLTMEIYIGSMSEAELNALFESIFGMSIDEFMAEYEAAYSMEMESMTPLEP